MADYDFDYFVIGAGSGGTRSARIAATHGARVAVAEDTYLGGTCVNAGCVPKKLFVYASHFAEDFEDAENFGWSVKHEAHSWKTLLANKDKEINRLNGVYRRLLEGAGATIFDGKAVLKDAHTVEVNGETHTADKILVATGGWPTVPGVPGKEHVITSNEAFHLDDLPERIVVVGGGYIAVEFAGIFNGLGADVTLIYRGPCVLRGFDDSVREVLSEEMIKKGIDVRYNTTVEAVTKQDDGSLILDLNKGSETIEAGLVMYATGRHPRTEGIGLEDAGVELDEKGAIKVNETWQTSVPNIYSIGDCTNTIQLTPVAIKEGHALADALFNPSGRDVSYDYVPSAVFSQPPIGTVGLTEAQARENHGRIDVYKSTFKPMKHTISGRDERTLMKLLVARETQKVVGMHMVGPEAGEIIQGFAAAIKAGATKADLDATVGIHPTAAEEFVTMRDPEPDPEEAAEAAE